MAEFDWIPILQGKYLTYYQIGALIFSAINLFCAFISFLIFLIIAKLQMSIIKQNKSSKAYKISKEMAYFSIFIWLSFIPLVCSALDVLSLAEGMLGMLAIYILALYIHNGVSVSRPRLQEIQLRQIYGNNQSDVLLYKNDSFVQRSLKGKINRKYLIIAIILSISLPLFFYKTCISFFNE